MKKLLTSSQMSYADNYTQSHFGISSLVLMERAALAACQEIYKRFSTETKVSVICGTGNNGGDGLAMVRILKEAGYRVSFFIIGNKEKFSESARVQFDTLNAYGYVESKTLKECVHGSGLVVDAIFGTGLSREVSGEYLDTFDSINQLSCSVMSIDISSGINGSTGKIMGGAVKSDFTVSFAFDKLGCYLPPGRDYSGEIIALDIGITDKSLPKETTPDESIVNAPVKEDLLNLIPDRTGGEHKGSYGRVLIVAGSSNMGGAACLCAMGALKSGAGLVKVYTDSSNRQVVLGQLPEAMLATYEGAFKSQDESMLLDLLSWADVVAVGPGLDTTEDKLLLLKTILDNYKGLLVADADALNLCAKHNLSFKREGFTVITPHIGEMSKLTGLESKEILSNIVDVARNYAMDNDLVCVLKSRTTITATPEGKTYLNLFGNNGMATGGSGDVLCGIIAGLLAQAKEPNDSVIGGVLLHSLAGDLAKEKTGPHAMLPSDIADNIGAVLKTNKIGA